MSDTFETRVGGERPPRKRRDARILIKAGPLLLATAAVALSGCGSGSDPQGSVVGAARKVAGLSWVRYQVQFAGPHFFPRTLEVTGARGAFDFRHELDYVFVAVRSRGGASENVFVDSSPNKFRVAPSPAPAGLLPAGKAWISVPVRGHREVGPIAAQVEGLAPLLALDEIMWGARTASSLGTRPVGHVPMDEYKVSVDLAKAYSVARAHGSLAVATAIKQALESSRSGRLTIDVWVNGPGYIAQVSERAPGSGLGTTSLSFLSYSQPYDGAFAPPSETVSLASLKTGRRSVWAVVTGS